MESLLIVAVAAEGGVIRPLNIWPEERGDYLSHQGPAVGVQGGRGANSLFWFLFVF